MHFVNTLKTNRWPSAFCEGFSRRIGHFPHFPLTFAWFPPMDTPFSENVQFIWERGNSVQRRRLTCEYAPNTEVGIRHDVVYDNGGWSGYISHVVYQNTSISQPENLWKCWKSCLVCILFPPSISTEFNLTRKRYIQTNRGLRGQQCWLDPAGIWHHVFKADGMIAGSFANI